MPGYRQTTIERRKKVMKCVIEIYEHTERVMGGAQSVRSFHIKYFGLGSCMSKRSLSAIQEDLRWLYCQGLLDKPDTRRANYVPNDKGRDFVSCLN